VALEIPHDYFDGHLIFLLTTPARPDIPSAPRQVQSASAHILKYNANTAAGAFRLQRQLMLLLASARTAPQKAAREHSIPCAAACSLCFSFLRAQHDARHVCLSDWTHFVIKNHSNRFSFWSKACRTSASTTAKSKECKNILLLIEITFFLP